MLPKYRAAASIAPDKAGPDAFALLTAASHQAATSQWSAYPDPSAAQAAANVYKVGRMVWQGLPIRIENPAHSIREGADPDGKPWRNMMQAAYGDFAGTKGADGDPVDLFMGPFPESRRVWVLNQRAADGSFDEHKILCGFVDEAHALSAYRYSYSPGWSRGGPATRITLDQLKWWLKWADTTRPFSLDLIPPEPDMTDDTLAPAAPDLTRVFWDSAAQPLGKTIAEVLYLCRANDGADGLILDPMTMGELMAGEEVIRMDALTVLVGKLEPQMRAMMRVMESAGADVKPLALQLSEPVRRHGGVHVAVLFELSDGQTVTIWFHNPDLTPAKLSIADTLVSWKWLLNKKDITIVVAPESGSDLNSREVGRRLMRLAAKNSAAFQKANAKRAETMAEIEGLKNTLVAKQGELQGLLGQIEVAKVEQSDRQAMGGGSEDPTAGEWVVNFEGSTNGGLYFTDVGQAKNYIDAKYDGSGGRLYWVQHLTSTEFRLPFTAMTAIKKNEGTRYPGSEEEIRPWFEKALRFANKEIGQYGADWMRKNLALLLSFFSGVSLEWAQRYVESKFKTEEQQLAELQQSAAAQQAAKAAGFAAGQIVGRADGSSVPKDSEAFNAAVAAYAGQGDLALWYESGWVDGWDAGRAEFLAAEKAASGPQPSDLWRKVSANDYRITDLTGQEWTVARVGSKWLTEAGQSFADLNAAKLAVEDSIAAAARTAAEEAASRADLAARAAEAAAATPAAPAAPDVYPFATATEEARALLAIGATNPARSSAYKTAVSLEKAAADLGLTIAWASTDTLPTFEEAALDAADGDFAFALKVVSGGASGFTARKVYRIVRKVGQNYIVENDDGKEVKVPVASLQFKPGETAFKSVDFNKVRLDGADGDDDGEEDEGPDFDPQAEFDAMPEDEEEEGDSDAKVLDSAIAAAVPYLTDRPVLDYVADTAAAVESLRIALSVVTTNEPINRAAGKVEQADLEKANAEQFRRAIAILDGDHPGHAFRGNQHVKASRVSSAAGSASRAAKRAQKAGNPKALKKAHRSAYHAHMAALEDAKGKTLKYHRTMAKFHGKQAGVVLDSVEELDPPEHTGPIRMLLTPEAQALLDKVGPINVFQSGDKVVSLDDNADYVVTGQRAHLVSVKGRKEPIVSNRLKLASGAKPATLILDAGGLFGDAEGGYIVGTISRNGVVVATVHLREDGQVAFTLDRDIELQAAGGHLGRDFTEFPEELQIGWRDDWFSALSELATVTEGVQNPEEAAAAQAAEFEAEAKAKAEREAQLAADESARAAALEEARAFGKGKPGFVGAIADRGGDAIKGALARKPVGSWILVLAKMSSSSDAGPGVQGDNRSAFAMFSRQMLGKGGRSINPAGKVGNVQVSRLMATAAEAYQSGIQALMNAGGVVLGMSGKPLNADGKDPGAAPAADNGILERIEGENGMYVNIVKSSKGGFNAILRDGDAEEMVTGTVNIPTLEGARQRAKEMLQGPSAPAGPTYRYALVNRPAMIGGLPSKLEYTVEPRPAPGQPHYEMARHGILVTQRELTTDELKNFELAPLVDGPLLDVLAAKIAESMGKYAAQYVQQSEEEPEQFRNKVLDVAERPDSGVRYSIGAPDALVDRVEMLLRGMAEKAGGDPNIGREWDTPTGRRQIVGTYGDDMYEAKNLSTGGVLRVFKTKLDEQIAADQFAMTPEYAEQKAAEKAAREAQAARDAESAAKAAALDAEIAKWTSAAGMSAMLAERARAALTKNRQRDGSLSTVGEIIRGQVAAGAVVADVRGEARLTDPSGSFLGEDQITKMGMDYARWLIAQRGASADPAPNIGAPAGDTQRVADMATLAQIAAGTHPEMLEPELADQIEAAMTRYPDDAELQALAEKAINAYSDGMMAATAKL